MNAACADPLAQDPRVELHPDEEEVEGEADLGGRRTRAARCPAGRGSPWPPARPRRAASARAGCPASTSPITRGWPNLAISVPTRRAARITAAIASISRPNVSSPLRFAGFLADAPGSGSGSANVAVTGSPPTVPESFVCSPAPETAKATAAVPPVAQSTSPVSWSSLRRSLPVAAAAEIDELARLDELEVLAEAGGVRRVEAGDRGLRVLVPALRDRQRDRDDQEGDDDDVADDQLRAADRPCPASEPMNRYSPRRRT